MNKTIKGIPLYLISAILGNIFYYTFLIPAAFLYPGYSPFQHTVSALGNTTENPNGWFLLSICLILIGIALIPFFISVKKWHESYPKVKNYMIAIQILGLFDCFSMVMIGISPTDTVSAQHDFWSLMNFLCIYINLLLFIIGLRNHPSYWKRLSIIGVMNFAFCASYLTLIIVYRLFANIFEHLTFIVVLGLILMFALNMYKEEL